MDEMLEMQPVVVRRQWALNVHLIRARRGHRACVEEEASGLGSVAVQRGGRCVYGCGARDVIIHSNLAPAPHCLSSLCYCRATTGSCYTSASDLTSVRTTNGGVSCHLEYRRHPAIRLPRAREYDGGLESGLPRLVRRHGWSGEGSDG